METPLFSQGEVSLRCQIDFL